jgi:hypothetical protein
VNAGEVIFRGESHPPSNHEVAHAVPDEADGVGSRQSLDDGGQRPAMVVDAGARAGIAKREHRRIEVVSQDVNQRPHRTAAFAQAVEHDHRGAGHG